MTPSPTLPRDLLAQALGNPRLVTAFEQQAQAISDTQQQGADNVAATSALQDATFITLSPNDALNGERVLEVGEGIKIEVTADKVRLSVDDEVPHVQGGFPVYLTAQNPVSVVLPNSGTLATRSNPEVLSNKTLQAPRVTALGDYADDAGASAGGVPVGGVYRTGSTLKVRVA